MAVSQGRGNVPDAQEDLTQIKRKLAWRMGIAGLMIIGLLGALWLFDAMTANRSLPEPPAPQFMEPVPVTKKSVTQALTSAEPIDNPSDGARPSLPESTAVPAERAALAELPPPPEIASQPSSSGQGKPQIRPSASSAASVPSRATVSRAEPPVVVVPAIEHSVTGSSPPAGRPRQSQVLPRLLSGFNLQAGVFADPRRAEELHARLLQEGIPATLETRVVVGPFRNREEVDAARAKMLVMGIDTVLLPKAGKK